MEFLLECIGFPPSHDFAGLAHHAARHGSPVAWRGPAGLHKSLELGDGLALHVDREEGEQGLSLFPFVRSACRLRVAVESLRTPPDSPCDAIVVGWVLAPKPSPSDCISGGPLGIAPLLGAENDSEYHPGAGIRGLGLGSTRLSALLTDARLLPKRIPAGHVLAVGLAGFAIHVDQLQADADRTLMIRPLNGPDDPAGCVEIAAPITGITELRNPLTGARIQRVEIDLDGRALGLHLSPWQLFEDGLRPARVGDRIEGTFLLSGRVLGGLPSVRRKVGACFG